MALKDVGIRLFATVLGNEFNLRYWAESITINTARNWLLANSIPMQDKLHVLVEWLHVSADVLRYGILAPTFKERKSGTDLSVLTIQNREMLTRYMTLSLADRNPVQCGISAGGTGFN